MLISFLILQQKYATGTQASQMQQMFLMRFKKAVFPWTNDCFTKDIDLTGVLLTKLPYIFWSNIGLLGHFACLMMLLSYLSFKLPHPTVRYNE